MKYAIFNFNGKQYRASEGDVVRLDSKPEGAKAVFSEVLLRVDGDDVKAGVPFVSKAQVKGTVLGEAKGKKIRVAKFKAKSNYRKVRGYRSTQYLVRIDTI